MVRAAREAVTGVAERSSVGREELGAEAAEAAYKRPSTRTKYLPQHLSNCEY